MNLPNYRILMKISAIPIVFLLATASMLAGCVSDPDAGSDFFMTEEMIEEIEAQLNDNLSRIAELEELVGVGNSAPLIYSISLGGDGSGSDDPHTYFVISAIDLDGEVVRLGLDVDLDGVIDYDLGDNGTTADYSKLTRYAVAWNSYPGEEIEDSGGYDGCFSRANIIAIDNNNSVSTHPELFDVHCPE
ncbi:uncharacterized protein METZ01_LOCUS219330 [marine metagenome]|uniref:Uncharacterized protein n=1 Tax=marine metagenome TaxID=408172 RepID=A0A382FTS3_9ZZZZ